MPAIKARKPKPTLASRKPSDGGQPANFLPVPVLYRRAADQVAASIRDSIANGSLRPGDHLHEVEIARAMHTSRVPVREAMIQLEQEGLVIRRPNRGSFVAELTEKILREVSALRGLLEGFAASRAVERLAPADFARLDGLINEMRAAAHEKDYHRLLQCDYLFHETIVHAADNELLEEIWRITHGKVRVYLSATNLVYSDRKTLVESHVALLESLRTRDPERAREAMVTHIDRPLNRFVARALWPAENGGSVEANVTAPDRKYRARPERPRAR
jgi:DNA-binding GntR family transcriptional regulator